MGTALKHVGAVGATSVLAPVPAAFSPPVFYIKTISFKQIKENAAHAFRRVFPEQGLRDMALRRCVELSSVTRLAGHRGVRVSSGAPCSKEECL